MPEREKTPFEQANDALEAAHAAVATAKAEVQLELESMFWEPETLELLEARIVVEPELDELARLIRKLLERMETHREASEAWAEAHRTAVQKERERDQSNPTGA